MKIVFLIFLFSFQSVGRDLPSTPKKSSDSLLKYGYVHVRLGYHQMDEYIFTKGKIWKVEWVDRASDKTSRHLKRMIPESIIKSLLTDLEFFLRKNQEHLSYDSFMGCSFRMQLTLGESKRKSSGRILCLDRLNKTANHDLGRWILHFSEKFRY